MLQMDPRSQGHDLTDYGCGLGSLGARHGLGLSDRLRRMVTRVRCKVTRPHHCVQRNATARAHRGAWEHARALTGMWQRCMQGQCSSAQPRCGVFRCSLVVSSFNLQLTENFAGMAAKLFDFLRTLNGAQIIP